MIPSNREIALTKALEFYRISGGFEAVLESAGNFLEFLDGPAPEDEVAAYQRKALEAAGVHEFPHEATS